MCLFQQDVKLKMLKLNSTNPGERIASSSLCDQDKHIGENGRTSPQFGTRHFRASSTGISHTISSGQPLSNIQTTTASGIRGATGAASSDHPYEHQLVIVLTKLSNLIERNEMRLTEQERRDIIKQEWQQIALVIDRFLLWIFVITTIGATLGILGMSPHARLY